MKHVEFVPPMKHPLWRLCLQMGIDEVVVKVNPDLTGLPAPWRQETLGKIVKGLADEGLKVIGLDVPVRGDHVPEMEGDRLITTDCVPGYFTMGRLFANGYIKALLKGTEDS